MFSTLWVNTSKKSAIRLSVLSLEWRKKGKTNITMSIMFELSLHGTSHCGGVEVEHLPHMQEIRVRSKVETDLSH